MKYVESVRKHFAKLAAFSIQDLRVFLKQKKISNAYTHQLIHYLSARGELKRITKGVYSFHDDTQLVGFAFKPCYHGLQDALSLRGLWEQETNPVIITPRKVRSGVRTFQGNNYLLRRIKREMFYGFETMKYGEHWINVSDVEKTLIDFAYFNEPLDEETLREIKTRIRKNELDRHLSRCPQRTVKKVSKLLESG